VLTETLGTAELSVHLAANDPVPVVHDQLAVVRVARVRERGTAFQEEQAVRGEATAAASSTRTARTTSTARAARAAADATKAAEVTTTDAACATWPARATGAARAETAFGRAALPDTTHECAAAIGARLRLLG